MWRQSGDLVATPRDTEDTLPQRTEVSVLFPDVVFFLITQTQTVTEVFFFNLNFVDG